VIPGEGPVPANGAPELQLQGAGLEWHGQRPLWDVDVRIGPGVPVLVTGPSGSGKTLLCMLLAGVLPPTAGAVLWGGRPLTDHPVARVGVVLQNHGLVGGLTALENVALPLQERRIHPAEISERSREALARVGLADEADRSVHDLSGGEQQRVGIARAVAGDPAILIADEPTSELDPANRERVLGVLLEERRRRASIVVVASDDPEIEKHFERVFVLGNGAVTVVARQRGGPPTEV
jgi:putative ABC transport system ATP-binding protein